MAIGVLLLIRRLICAVDQGSFLGCATQYVMELGLQNWSFELPRVQPSLKIDFDRVKPPDFHQLVCGFELWYTF